MSPRKGADRDLVRRWTGGGIVLHGEDLTYALVTPATDPAAALGPDDDLCRSPWRDSRCVAGRRTRGQIGARSRAQDLRRLFRQSRARRLILLSGGAKSRAPRSAERGAGFFIRAAFNCPICRNHFATDSRPCFRRRIERGEISFAGPGTRRSVLAAEKYGTEAWLRRC